VWIRTEAFHTSKRGNAENEYEDAFYPDAVDRNETRFRCAVADGASESAFSGVWAKLLVTSFARGRMRLDHLRQVLERSIAGDSGTGAELPWYLQSKVGNGAHAAFVGLSMHDRPGSNGTPGRWRALAMGDSCLFQAREGKLVTCGPMDCASSFNNSPFLVASKTTRSLRRGADGVTIMQGTWMPGDAFYLATDAISQWLLARHEAGDPRWPMLRALGPKTFLELVDELREQGELHNDDTTILRVEVA